MKEKSNSISKTKIIIFSILIITLVVVIVFFLVPRLVNYKQFIDASDKHIKFAEIEQHNLSIIGNGQFTERIYELYTDGVIKYTEKFYHMYLEIPDVEKTIQLDPKELISINRFLVNNIVTGKYSTDGGKTIIKNGIIPDVIDAMDGSGFKIIYYGPDSTMNISFGPGYIDDKMEDELIQVLRNKIK